MRGIKCEHSDQIIHSKTDFAYNREKNVGVGELIFLIRFKRIIYYYFLKCQLPQKCINQEAKNKSGIKRRITEEHSFRMHSTNFKIWEFKRKIKRQKMLKQ